MIRVKLVEPNQLPCNVAGVAVHRPGDLLEWAVFLELCRTLQPKLIIFDTQARITVGIEENSNTEMGQFFDGIENLRSATGACVALIHHQGHKGEQGRGASSVRGALQTELIISKAGTRPDTRITVRSDKQKDDEEADDVVFAVHVVKLDHEAKEDGSPVTSVVLVPADGAALPTEPKRAPATIKILEALEGAHADGEEAVTAKVIVDRIVATHGHGLRRETVSKALNDLLGEGVVDRILESKGAAALWTLLPRSEDM